MAGCGRSGAQLEVGNRSARYVVIIGCLSRFFFRFGACEDRFAKVHAALLFSFLNRLDLLIASALVLTSIVFVPWLFIIPISVLLFFLSLFLPFLFFCFALLFFFIEKLSFAVCVLAKYLLRLEIEDCCPDIRSKESLFLSDVVVEFTSLLSFLHGENEPDFRAVHMGHFQIVVDAF